MTTTSLLRRGALALAVAGFCALGATACSGSPGATVTSAGQGAAPASSGATSASSGSSGSSTASIDACTLVTAAELSQAVGVQYTAVGGSGGFCNVTGPGSAGFDFSVEKESPTNTWSQQVATITGDDGQALPESGVGDKAVWGGKEFAAEDKGYIVGVIDADFPSTNSTDPTRTLLIAKLLISKL